MDCLAVNEKALDFKVKMEMNTVKKVFDNICYYNCNHSCVLFVIKNWKV